MSTSFWSTAEKVVNFGSVFSGFSLHHLFMHMNLFGRRSALQGLECSKWCFWGSAVLLASKRWVACQGEGLWAVLHLYTSSATAPWMVKWEEGPSSSPGTCRSPQNFIKFFSRNTTFDFFKKSNEMAAAASSTLEVESQDVIRLMLQFLKVSFWSVVSMHCTWNAQHFCIRYGAVVFPLKKNISLRWNGSLQLNLILRFSTSSGCGITLVANEYVWFSTYIKEVALFQAHISSVIFSTEKQRRRGAKAPHGHGRYRWSCSLELTSISCEYHYRSLRSPTFAS